MCGICGYITPTAFPDTLLSAMNDTLRHRGPDSAGYYRTPAVGLAMRRLSVIDLDTGDQPIFGADRTRVIIFNGEIYNYGELRQEFLQQGYPFQTHSDTEVILAGYACEGVKIFTRLNGMFAIAIYDQSKGQLILARDRIGIKPLFYTQQQGHFIFGSEIKAILPHPAYHKQINYLAFDKVLTYKFIPGEETMFHGIKKLQPGHILVVNLAGSILEDTAYWSLDPCLAVTPLTSYSEARAELRTRLSNAVKKRLLSDVPVGAFLSGGIDSGIIVGLMAQHLAQAVKTFSIGFDAKSYNELRWARLSAQRYHTDHHEHVIHPHDILELVDDLVGYLDEPFGDASIIPMYYVSQFTRQAVTVALSGSGADELFAGYERYWVNRFDPILTRVPARLRDALTRLLNQIPERGQKKDLGWRMRVLLNDFKQPLPERYHRILTLLAYAARQDLYHPEIRAHGIPTLHQEILHSLDVAKDADFLSRCAYADIKTILVDDYLVKEDRMSMANSLEVRVPFLDFELVEFSMRLPTSWKLRGLKTKYILKDACSDLLPPAILRRGKYGFETPFGLWARQELRDPIRERLIHSTLISSQIFNSDRLEQIFQEHAGGKMNHSKLLFTLVTLESWLRQYFPS